MARQLAWAIAALLACATSTGASATHDRAQKSSDKPPQSSERRDSRGFERVRWWEDAKWRADLVLTDKQAGKIKEIFEVEMVKLRAMREELEKRQATLTQAMNEERPSWTTVTEQVERVGAMHAEMYRTRTLMLFRMHRVLSTEQRARLQVMIDKAERERRKTDPNRYR